MTRIRPGLLALTLALSALPADRTGFAPTPPAPPVYVPPEQRQRRAAPEPPVETKPEGRGARRRAKRAEKKGGNGR